MNLKQSLFAALALAAGFALTTTESQAQAKVGVFDAQKITVETAEGAKIQARLTALKEKKTGELKKLQEEIEKLQQEFVQTAASASEEKRKELGLRIQRKQDELDGAQKAANRELQLEVEAAQEGWQRRVLEVVNKYGKDNGYTLIIPAEVAIYFSPSIDVTADLVKLVDAATPAAAPKK